MPSPAPQLVEGQPARLDVGTSLPCRINLARDDRLLLASLALAYHRGR
jgi:hypothetical protein